MKPTNVNENIQEEKINTGCNSTGRANEFASLKNNIINKFHNYFSGERKMKTTRLFMKASVVLALIVSLSSSSLFAQTPYTIPGITGTGTQLSPYLINSDSGTTPLWKLNKITDWVNQTGSWDKIWTSQNRHFKLMANINYITIPIGKKPTGNATTAFQGTFDGNGYTIKILNIPTNVSANLGVFGFTKNATIKNLIVEGDITCHSYSSNTSLFNAGGIVAEGENTIITNCINTAKISISASDFLGVGGIAGELRNNSQITLCANTGEITTSLYNASTSGICANSQYCAFSRCINIGTISAEASGSVGGIAGYADYTTMNNCANAGWVSGYTFVGGIAGSVLSLISMKNCLNTGVVDGKSSYHSLVGRFNFSYASNVTNCFYDKQMSPYTAIAGIVDDIYTPPGRKTLDLLKFKDVLNGSNSFWSSTPGFGASFGSYPYLNTSGITNSNIIAAYSKIAYIAASPVRLTNDNVTLVNQMYILDCLNNIKWWSLEATLMPVPSASVTYGSNQSPYTGRQELIASMSTDFSNYPYRKIVPIMTTGEQFKNSNGTGISEVRQVMLDVVIDNTAINITTAAEGNLNAAIYDLAGSKIMDIFDGFANENSLVRLDLNNLSHLATGTYVVVVTSGNDVAAKKFIKQP